MERLYRGLTQKQIAEQLGLTTQSYQVYETGHSTPSAFNLLKLAVILNLSLDDLFEIDLK